MKMIIIGGSAGSFNVILSILKELDADISMPIVIVLHRLKKAKAILEDCLQTQSHYIVKEVEDKEFAKAGYIYTAPSDYHVLLNENLSFSLDTSEEVNYSRPSIDVSFESFSCVLKENCCGILLSGANQDGAIGLKMIAENGGETIVQDGDEAEFATMPRAAIELYKKHTVYKLKDIVKKMNNYAK
ncbi:chemotaxis protein CheB [Flavobacterium degerlachei]|jgi:two-component system chemotaxis response regulator CheB|uniref:protein-glutamate methylesterase n=1 Tax=Flavobacterium degerlachei TaxID=229203 RepID=A0A1H2U9C4_9FLAO|nr:chemotaxis protein CheB [Flavobacterium degerlachei]SDW52488.1 two-component system, chemotaxis family, response regulator CheB [Flavobacterium degerlachei]